MPCLNCGTEFAGAFCPNCGQRVPHTDLTLREFLHDTTHELTSWDGKIPRTLRALFLAPGLLTQDFLAGRRARWLLPLRLYLICSLAFFVSKPLVESITHRSAREIAKISLTDPNGSTELTPEMRAQLAEGWPARVFGTERLERAAKNSRKLNQAIDAAFPKAMFILLPLFAFLTSIAWRRQLARYPAHLYLALHLHAAWFGALAIGTLLSALHPSNEWALATGGAAIGYVVLYTALAFRRVFAQSWPRTLGKSVLVAGAYFACLGAVSLGLLGYALLTM